MGQTPESPWPRGAWLEGLAYGKARFKIPTWKLFGHVSCRKRKMIFFRTERGSGMVCQACFLFNKLDDPNSFLGRQKSGCKSRFLSFVWFPDPWIYLSSCSKSACAVYHPLQDLFFPPRNTRNVLFRSPRFLFWPHDMFGKHVVLIQLDVNMY